MNRRKPAARIGRALIALVLTTAGALVAASSASPQQRWQHPSKTEWFHKAALHIEHRIHWTYNGTAGCSPPNSNQRVQVPVKGEGTVTVRGTPHPSWPSIWRLEKDTFQGYRGVFGEPGFYDVGGNNGGRGGIMVNLHFEERGQMTTYLSACGRPDRTEEADPFLYECNKGQRHTVIVNYNQRPEYSRRHRRMMLERGPEHRRTLYVDDHGVSGRPDELSPWKRVCYFETKQRNVSVPWRSRKPLTFAWSEAKSGRIQKAGFAPYEWTSTTTVRFDLTACRAKYSRGSFPEFKGCR